MSRARDGLPLDLLLEPLVQLVRFLARLGEVTDIDEMKIAHPA